MNELGIIQTKPVFIKVGRVAEILGMSISTIRRWEEEGYLPTGGRTKAGTRIYDLHEIEKFALAIGEKNYKEDAFMRPEIKVGEVAKMLQVSSSTVRRMHLMGQLEPSRVSSTGTRFYDRKAVEAMACPVVTRVTEGGGVVLDDVYSNVQLCDMFFSGVSDSGVPVHFFKDICTHVFNSRADIVDDDNVVTINKAGILEYLLNGNIPANKDAKGLAYRYKQEVIAALVDLVEGRGVYTDFIAAIPTPNLSNDNVLEAYLEDEAPLQEADAAPLEDSKPIQETPLQDATPSNIFKKWETKK